MFVRAKTVLLVDEERAVHKSFAIVCLHKSVGEAAGMPPKPGKSAGEATDMLTKPGKSVAPATDLPPNPGESVRPETDMPAKRGKSVGEATDMPTKPLKSVRPATDMPTKPGKSVRPPWSPQWQKPSASSLQSKHPSHLTETADINRSRKEANRTLGQIHTELVYKLLSKYHSITYLNK